MATVLIIDDDKLICDWIANVVTRLGHRPVSAQLLREGLSETPIRVLRCRFCRRAPARRKRLGEHAEDQKHPVFPGDHRDHRAGPSRRSRTRHQERRLGLSGKTGFVRCHQAAPSSGPGISIGTKTGEYRGRLEKRRHHRRFAGDRDLSGTRGPGGGQRCQCSHHRRNRHRQGAFCQGRPCEQPQGPKELCGR